MRVTFDPAKRQITLAERGLDFARAGDVFKGRYRFDWVDTRKKYPEHRIRTLGILDGELIHLVWTSRDESVRVISMRKADTAERRDLGVPG